MNQQEYKKVQARHGAKGGKKIFDKIGVAGMKRLSRKAVEARKRSKVSKSKKSK